MQKVQTVGSRAYALYRESSNDCAPMDFSRFASGNDFMGHAWSVEKEHSLPLSKDKFEGFSDSYSTDEFLQSEIISDQNDDTVRTVAPSSTPHSRAREGWSFEYCNKSSLL